MPRVLVVDDDIALRQYAGLLLGAGGFDVDLVPDRAAALATLRSRPVDVVVCDMFLADDCGLELVREIAGEFPAAGVVAMSGGAFQGRLDVLDVARHLGAPTVLRKPFSGSELLTAVWAALAWREGRALPPATVTLPPDA